MWLQILIYLALGLLALYFYLARNNNFWKKQGVPFVPPKPFVGSLSSLRPKPLYEWDSDNYKKYGRLFGYFEGSYPRLMVAEPELIRDITIKDFQTFPNRRGFDVSDEITLNMLPLLKGERWKRVRIAMSSAFSSGKMRKMASIINECVETACANFQEVVERKRNADVKKVFGAFTMDVIATVAFGVKLDSHHDPNNPFVQHAKKVFSNDSKFSLLFLFAFPTVSRILGLQFFDSESVHFFKKMTKDILRKRREDNQEGKRYDMLQLLLSDITEAKKMLGKDAEENETNEDGQHDGLSEIEIIAQCVLFFIAAYDSTASVLSFLAYNLALNPDCQEKLAMEVRKTLRENNNVIDYDILKKMPYLNAVVSETLRLHPPGERAERVCVEEYVLGNTGVTLPKGMVTVIPIYPIHHDSEYFPDPEKFDPQRFLPENKDSIKPYTYIPFGSGPRTCVAERLALFEIKLCMAKVVSKFRFRTTSETKIPPKIYVNQGVLVPHNITLKVERRE